MAKSNYDVNTAAEQLGALPVFNPDRIDLRARYARYTPDQLAAKTRGWLTLSAEYAARSKYARELANPPANVYPAWAKANHQGKPQPFESGFNCLPGMESFAEQIRQTA